jgi:hypothetical protein
MEEGAKTLVQNEPPTSSGNSTGGQKSKSELIFAGYAECFPLFSLMAALQVTTIDYLSLDIQGSELKVLRAVPFDKLTIKVRWITRRTKSKSYFFIYLC